MLKNNIKHLFSIGSLEVSCMKACREAEESKLQYEICKMLSIKSHVLN